jgi:hypothetical protein
VNENENPSQSRSYEHHSAELKQIEEVPTPRPTRLVRQDDDLQPGIEVMLRHSNELVEKYRKMLTVKEKELKKREKKLESSKLAM